MKNIVTIGRRDRNFSLRFPRLKYPVRLAAVVSMADYGGSTGMFATRYGVPLLGRYPPGALWRFSESSETMRDLFNYRFKGGGLNRAQFRQSFSYGA